MFECPRSLAANYISDPDFGDTKRGFARSNHHGGTFGIAGAQHPQRALWQVAGQCRGSGVLRASGVDTGAVEQQRALPRRHRQIDIRQQFDVEQRPMQGAMLVVDAKALAQRIEAVALAGVTLAGQLQRIDHAAQVAQTLRPTHPRQLSIEEADVLLAALGEVLA